MVDQLHGYDVSNLNGSISLAAQVPKGDFFVAKVTQDSSFIDEFFLDFRTEARQLEAAFGGYHYGDDTEQPDAEASCNFFLDHLGTQQQGEFSALDIENDSGEGGFKPGNRAPWVAKWGQTFVKLKNYKPKLYVSMAGLVDFQLNKLEIPEVFDLWLAYWLDNPNDTSTPPKAPAPFLGTTKFLWQYNADVIDKNKWLGTREELKATGHNAQSPAPDSYESRYWTPMQNLLNELVANSPANRRHADAAFHASISNIITLHKISVGVEPAG